jgi:hypothetical protein
MPSSFAAYVVGFIILIIGLAWGAHLAGVPPEWIGVGVVVLIGIGVLTGVTRTTRREHPDSAGPRGGRSY